MPVTHKNALYDLSAETIRQIFDYEPETGRLLWRQRVGGHSSIGKEAGSLKRGKKNRRQVFIGGRGYLSHRLIWVWMTGAWPVEEIDHTNRDSMDNRWINLRAASSSENCCNRPLAKNNTTGVKGVYLHRATGRYIAKISRHGQMYHLGYFGTKDEAAEAYRNAAEKLHGEFANAARAHR